MNTPSGSDALRGSTLYFDCFSGIAGDMTLGALLDLGVPESVVRQALSRLDLQAYELRIRKVRKGALNALHVEVLEPDHAQHAAHHHDAHQQHHVHSHDHDAHSHDHDAHSHDHGHGHTELANHPHIHYGQIRTLLEAAFLADAAAEVADIGRRALAMFDRLAAVEAQIHGVAVSEVAFHEVGALDSIVDIVGTAAALSWLRPQRVLARPVPLGSGMVRTAHGLLPVPAPATLALLHGVPVESGGPPYELCTPTGAVILACNACSYGSLPAMRVIGVGHGAGTRELADRPNLLRVMAGIESAAEVSASASCLVLEANIDDMNPQLFSPLMESLFQAGARDAWLTPVHMKKGRPGVVVSVLCDSAQRQELVDVLLRESTTLGVRMHAVERQVLDRQSIEVSTEFGRVTIKLGKDPQSGQVRNVAPEFSSAVQRASAAAVPIKTVLAAALAAYYQDPQNPT